jgi:predicted RNase H-like HicB family nuclease
MLARRAMSREFTAIFEKHGRWYIAYVEEIPGVNTQGRTLAEARENLKEALQLILEENRRLLPKKRSATTKRELITVEL